MPNRSLVRMGLADYARSRTLAVFRPPAIDAPRVDARLPDHPHLYDPELVVVPLENVVVMPDGFVLTDDGVFIEDLGYQDRIARNEAEARALDGAAIAGSNEPAFLLGGDANYYHWLLNWLPRLFLLEFLDVGRLPLLLGRSVTRVQRDSLQTLFGVDRFPLKPCPAPILVDRLWVPTFFRNPMHAPFAVRQLRARASERTGVVRGGRRRIYISRSKARSRRIVNEDELFARLSSEFGFERCVLEEMTFAEQVALFSSASSIVAPHGAGLANLVFVPPECRVFEIRNSFYTRVFWSLACLVGATNYTIVEGNSIQAGSQHRQKDDIELPVEPFVEQYGKVTAGV